MLGYVDIRYSEMQKLLLRDEQRAKFYSSDPGLPDDVAKAVEQAQLLIKIFFALAQFGLQVIVVGILGFFFLKLGKNFPAYAYTIWIGSTLLYWFYQYPILLKFFGQLRAEIRRARLPYHVPSAFEITKTWAFRYVCNLAILGLIMYGASLIYGVPFTLTGDVNPGRGIETALAQQIDPGMIMGWFLVQGALVYVRDIRARPEIRA